MKNCAYQKYNKVLVPLGGGPNSALALEVASILAEKEGGEVTALTVHRPGELLDFDVKEFIEENRETLALPAAQVHEAPVALPAFAQLRRSGQRAQGHPFGGAVGGVGVLHREGGGRFVHGVLCLRAPRGVAPAGMKKPGWLPPNRVFRVGRPVSAPPGRLRSISSPRCPFRRNRSRNS